MKKEEKTQFNTFKEAVAYRDKITLINDSDRNRYQRRAISELRKEGIVFVPIGNFVYKRIELCTREQKDKFINTHTASLRTQYLNTLKPLKDHMTKEQLDYIHNGGLFKDYEDEEF